MLTDLFGAHVASARNSSVRGRRTHRRARSPPGVCGNHFSVRILQALASKQADTQSQDMPWKAVKSQVSALLGTPLSALGQRLI